MLQIKICGITRAEDALAAATAGADAIGLVFHPGSRRCVTPAQAATICASLPPFTATVGLFVDPAPGAVAEVLDAVPLSHLQFHGSEAPALCRSFGRPYLRALGVHPGADISGLFAAYHDARGWLVDTHDPVAHGGTGKTFDWSLLADLDSERLVLAGGLTPANVAEAVRRVRPAAVDVSSGVESAPGIKETDKLRAFINAARAAAGEPQP